MASGLKNIETIESPFRRFVTTIGVFPTAFTDAMTYYECLAYLVKYLEDSVVPAVNENAEALKELQDYVAHYFDNLDVQEEINNKLDQMAEAGTLQEIIGDYLNASAVWGFDTVSDMKESTNLINGSFARTLGYHAKNDGGGAIYKIRTITNDDIVDEASIIEMSNDDSLVAELIIEHHVNAKQFGAYGDGTHDDGTSIQKAINFINRKRISVTLHDKNGKGTRTFSTQPTLFLPFATYKINTPLSLTEHSYYIDGDNSYITSDNNIDIFYFTEAGGTKSTIKNLVFKNTYNAIRFNCTNIDNSKVTIEHCRFLSVANIALNISNRSCMLEVDDCWFSWCYRILVNERCDNVKFSNCWFSEFEANENAYHSFEVLWGEVKFDNCFFIPNGNYNNEIDQSLLTDLCWIQMGDNISAPEDNSPKVYINNCRISSETNAKALINYMCIIENTTAVTQTSIIITNCNALADNLYPYIVKLWHLPQQIIIENNKIGVRNNAFVAFDSSLNFETELNTYYSVIGNRPLYAIDYSFQNNTTQSMDNYMVMPSEIAPFVRHSDFDIPVYFDENNKVHFNFGLVQTSNNDFFRKTFLVKVYYNNRNNYSGSCQVIGLLTFNTNSNDGTQVTTKFTPLVNDIGGPGTVPTITPTFDSTETSSIALSAGTQQNLKITLTNNQTVQSISGTSPSYVTIKEI